jgi:hypothetical protein
MTNAEDMLVGFLIPVPRLSFWAMLDQAARDAAVRLGLRLSVAYAAYMTVGDEVAAVHRDIAGVHSRWIERLGQAFMDLKSLMAHYMKWYSAAYSRRL